MALSLKSYGLVENSDKFKFLSLHLSSTLLIPLLSSFPQILLPAYKV